MSRPPVVLELGLGTKLTLNRVSLTFASGVEEKASSAHRDDVVFRVGEERCERPFPGDVSRFADDVRSCLEFCHLPVFPCRQFYTAPDLPALVLLSLCRSRPRRSPVDHSFYHRCFQTGESGAHGAWGEDTRPRLARLLWRCRHFGDYASSLTVYVIVLYSNVVPSASAVTPFSTLHDFHGIETYFTPPSPVDGDVALGILRLSHKYAVNYLDARAISQLETIYNIDPTIYKALSHDSQPHQKQTLAFHLKALPILIEVDAVWLLPMAFYSIGTYSLSDLRSAGAPWDTLSQQSQSTASSPISAKGNPYECGWTKLHHIEGRITRQASVSQDPLASYNNKHWLVMEIVFCTSCVANHQEDHATAFAEVWDKLPQNCGLDNWDVLLQRRREVMG
ncbi:hypothetical protein B0H12DRAFT_1325222 [Mycena haematopus]|nr:hypothetical protein B0H12DRAFT_1325222 [Mycena haematopus]